MWTSIEKRQNDTICFSPKQSDAIVDDELKIMFRVVPSWRLHEAWASGDGRFFLSLYEGYGKGEREVVEVDESNFFKVIGTFGWKKEEK